LNSTGNTPKKSSVTAQRAIRLLQEKQILSQIDVVANSYRDIFVIEKLPDLTDVYFVVLELKNGSGRVVADNFYWQSSNVPPIDREACRTFQSQFDRNYPNPADFSALLNLPPVRLIASHTIEEQGNQKIAHVKVTNPTDKLAFFVHLSFTRIADAEEVLPVFWDDNYFSLLPGETKLLKAAFERKLLQATPIVLEIGGWNVKSSYECTILKISKDNLRQGEDFTVTATIKNTFIDGSRVELIVDDKISDTKLFYARAKDRKLNFNLKFTQPGRHEIKVANQTIDVVVLYK